MADAILTFVETVMASPWLYLVLFAVAAVDGFFPLVPSESSVITAGVFAAAGEPSLPLVIVAAALGAFAGDQVSYVLGRTAGPRLYRRAHPGSRRRRALDRARGALAERGGLIIVAARYFPGARTAVTLTAGAVDYRRRRFAAFAGIAALTWGTYSALVGYVGGAAFERDPLKGLLLGLGLAAAVTVVVELARIVRRRRVGDRLAISRLPTGPSRSPGPAPCR